MWCQKSEFKCAKSGYCIPNGWRCDGELDCEARNCSESEFRCSDKRCILKSFRCDGIYQCNDTSDEDWTAPGKNLKSEFKCAKSGYCIPNGWRCDGELDCQDNSDELSCSKFYVITLMIMTSVPGTAYQRPAVICAAELFGRGCLVDLSQLYLTERYLSLLECTSDQIYYNFLDISLVSLNILFTYQLKYVMGWSWLSTEYKDWMKSDLMSHDVIGQSRGGWLEWTNQSGCCNHSSSESFCTWHVTPKWHQCILPSFSKSDMFLEWVPVPELYLHSTTMAVWRSGWLSR